MQQLNTILQFKTQDELINALNILKPMFFFAVYNGGKRHEIEFRSLADAKRAAETLKEQIHVNQ